MSKRREQLNNADIDSPETYTLEDILAEYKSEAFIKNERRLSKDQLEQRAQAIIDEMKMSVERELSRAEDDEAEASAESAAEGDEPAADAEPTAGESEPQKGAEPTEEAGPDADAEQTSGEEPEPQTAEEAEAPEEKREEPTEAERRSDEGQSAVPDGGEQTAAAADPSPTQERESAAQPGVQEEVYFDNEIYAGAEFVRKSAQKAEAAINRSRLRQKRRNTAEVPENREKSDGPKPKKRELSLAEASYKYTSGIGGLRRREFAAMAISLIMTAAILIYGRLSVHWAGMGTVSLVMCALQIVVMALGADILLSGLGGFARMRPRSESLVTLACAAALAEAVAAWVGKADELGLPFCAAASLSMAFALRGERLKKTGYRTSLRTVKAAKIPTVVTADGERIEDGTVMTKGLGSTAGFISKLVSPGLYEKAAAKLFPLLLVGVVVLSAAASALNGGRSFLRCIAAMSTVSASLTASTAFSKPFSKTARRLADYGAVIGGWKGAEEINAIKGIIIRDNDIFPENTVSLNGIKVLYGASADKIISYTGSLIIASGSGLSRLFGELLREYAAAVYRVDEFSCYEGGGIGALIGGDTVRVGSAAFMKLLGINVPDNMDVPGAVFSALNGELSGVFIINYNPSSLVQNSLSSLMKSRIKPLYALRDFNLTPAMLKSKYSVNASDIDMLSFADRYSLSSEKDRDEQPVPSAIMSREGLNNYLEVATGGRRLIKAVKRMLAATAVSSALGLLTVFYVCATGAFGSASAENVLIYLLLWGLAAGLLGDLAGE